MAYLSSMMVNIVKALYGDSKRSKEQVLADMSSPADFMPEWDKDPDEEIEKVLPKKQSTQQMKDFLLSFAAKQNKNVDRDKMISEREPSIKVKKK